MSTASHSAVLIAVMSAVTVLLRALPFLVFRKKVPAYVSYLGRVLPPAIIGMLVIYCLKDTAVTAAPFGAPELIAAMTKIHQYTMLCAPITAQLAAVEALRRGAKYRDKMVAEYDMRRGFIYQGLTKLGLSCFEPKGAFYIFPDVSSTGLSSEDFAEKLLMSEHVALVPGTAFGDCGKGYVRCSYATSLDKIDEALARIGNFLAQHTDFHA